MISAPLSTAQRTALAIWSSVETSDLVSEPKATEMLSSCASGATPSTPLPVAGSPAREEGGHLGAVGVLVADGLLPVRGTDARDIRSPDDDAIQLGDGAVDPGVDDGDLDTGALARGPRLGEAVVVEPVLEVAHGVGVCRRRVEDDGARSEKGH